MLGVVAAGVLWWVSIAASHDRKWMVDQAVLPEAIIDGDLVHIKNIRNFSYNSPSEYVPNYYDKTFDLTKLQRAYYIVEPFSDFGGAAHTFVSFEFEGPEFLAISVEIRKEQGESFSALKGLFKQYELMYVVADEQDVVRLRSNYRHDDVFVHPVTSTPERMRSVFLDMLARVNEIKEQPEFYNTLTNTCTTNIVRHVNAVVPGRIPLDPRILFPGYSDTFAYELGLIGNELSLEEAREKYHINARALQYADSPDFSIKIRESQ